MFIFASDFLQVVQKVAERIPVIKNDWDFFIYINLVNILVQLAKKYYI